MKQYLFLLLILILNWVGFAQVNLVPNPSFENYSSCPTGHAELSKAVPWYDPTGATSDYFNACATVASVSVPNQTSGMWQYAKTGVAFAGFFSRGMTGDDYREYIQVALVDSLINGNYYLVSFYVNLNNRSMRATNNIGAYISKTAVGGTPPPFVLNYTPQILLFGNPVIGDTTIWTNISGLYFATGGEKYITIGNFRNDSNTVTQIIDASALMDWSYYNIDDVSLVDCSDSINSVSETTPFSNINYYPNPSNGNVTIDLGKIYENFTVQVHNIMGQLIQSKKYESINKIGVTIEQPNGIYFIRFITKHGESITLKVIKG